VLRAHPLAYCPDQDDGYIPPKTEAQLLETLLKIRAKDQSIYAPDAKFYSSGEEEEEEEGGGERDGAAGKAAGAMGGVFLACAR
jgi:hypothetical protein